MFVYTVNFQFRKGGNSMRYEKHRNTLTVFLEGELDHCCAQSIRREMDRSGLRRIRKGIAMDRKEV
jgi:hypothetical protein